MSEELSLRQQLAELFQETVAQHHHAYAEVDGFDPDWPIWYADYLQPRLTQLLDASFTRSQLVYLLVRVESERQLEAPGAEWTGYYAAFFEQRYRP